MNAGTAVRELPRRVSGARSTVLWGFALLVLIEGMVIASLVISYFYLRIGVAAWPPAGIPIPGLGVPTLALALLVASVAPVAWAERGIARGSRARLAAGLVAGLLLLGAYGATTLISSGDRIYTWSTNAYGSIVWTIEGYQLMHVTALLIFGAAVAVLALRGYFNAERRVAVQAVALYWYFTAASSAVAYATIYLSPRLI